MKIDSTDARYIGRTIHTYLTPYAIFLVAMAAVATGLNAVTLAALVMVILTWIGNVLFVNYYLKRFPGKTGLIRMIRIGFNYAFNIFIVWLLWPLWPPIWMLLLLSICTIAIFEDRRTTAITAALFTSVLITIQISHGDYLWPSMCELITRIITVWVAGMLINRLLHGIEA
jgi:hypothetical protein